MSDTSDRLAAVALSTWGCRRPDKLHRMDAAGAARDRAAANASLPAEPGVERHVYRCCDAGWVWGRLKAGSTVSGDVLR